MNRLSPDSQWWWDGAQWVLAAGLPVSIPETEFERSGRKEGAKKLLEVRMAIFFGFYAAAATVFGGVFLPILLIAYMIVQHRAFKAYREWTLEQIAAATTQLLGPEEPMVAGEASIRALSGFWPRERRDCAIAVTSTHVLMFRFPDYDFDASQCYLGFAAGQGQVEIVFTRGLTGRPSGLSVAHAGSRWFVRGTWFVFKGDSVMKAWQDIERRNVPGAVEARPNLALSG